MATPVHPDRRGEQSTPLSGRHTAVLRTPQSALTPNDDAAEKASVRRKKRSEALRKSLSDAFAGSSEQQQQQHGVNAGKPTLSQEALSTMFEQCIKLAAENKITDKNVWQLDLIQHLPSIVQAGQAGVLRGGGSFNFQKMSGGLDAGVTIYSKRVDTTYKEAFLKLQGIGANSRGYEDDGDDAAGADGEEDDNDVEDAAAAAAKQAKQGTAAAAAGKRGKATAAREEATLAGADALRQKTFDNTFAVDPLFHKMSALFDEGGAKGLLLLNRSVYRGANIMTDPHEVPEQQFTLSTAAAAEPDALISLHPLRRELEACQSASSSGAVMQLTPGLGQMYSLLEQAMQRLPGHQQQRQHGPGGSLDVTAIVEQATRSLPATPMPPRACSSTAPAAAGAAAGAPAAANSDSAVQCQGNAAAPPADYVADAAAAAAAGIQAGSAIVAAFLAEAAAAGQDDEYAAAADGSWGDAAGMGGEDGIAGDDYGGGGHAGYEDDDGLEEFGAAAGAGGPATTWEQEQRRQSGGQGLLGLGSSGAEAGEADEVLDAEALQQLLGGSGFNAKAAPTTGGGWAGSRFWKYKSAAAAIARLGGGSTAAKKAPAAGTRGRSGQLRIDFENLPELPQGALAHGSRKQTCLVSAASTAPTLLPQDLHYQASSLGQFFLKPAPVSCVRQHGNGSGRSGAIGESAAGEAGASWGDCSDNGDGGWGGDGYGEDGDYGGGGAADGYNPDDLSVDGPGYGSSGMPAEEDGASGDWWSPEHELLSAPKRNAGLGVNYNRSAKQVDVRALKDLLWDSLVNVKSHTAAGSGSSLDADEEQDQGGAAAPAGGSPTIPFQDVIVAVPEQSAAGSLEDVSVHMCFICLLHLANEKGLVIKAKEDLKTLTISNVNAV